MQARSLVAFNTATASANRIHDDAVASRLGFRGGLVPGVDVYAYLTHLPASSWGVDWLARGGLSARFVEPVYDGETTQVVPVRTLPSGAVELEVRNEAGAVCATATAHPPADDLPVVDPAQWPDVAPRDLPPPASPDALAVGTALTLPAHGFRSDRAGEYLDDVREDLALYREQRVAHPGWVLRDANYVLSTNVRLGPWIHVESHVQHHGLVADGASVSARAIVTGEWERKGHRFVSLDVLHLADGRPVARTAHTAIYQPRGT